MKITLRQTLPSVCVIICLATLQRAGARDEGDAAKPEMSSGATEASKPSEGTPAKFNKASGIIGMDVRNQDNEHLGHIKDIVFDLNSERVSYAVLDTSSKVMLGLKEKLLAVPMSALTPSSDQKHLVLNADKSKVETAMGFDQNNWPSVTSPVWGAEPFWQTKTEKSMMTTEPAKDSETTPKPDMKSDSDPESDPEANPNPDPESESAEGMEPPSHTPDQ